MVRRSVLLIDNNSQSLFTKSQILEKNQYQVTLALNGSSGIDYIKKSTFALILSEFSMGDTSALSILETARNTHTDTRVILQVEPLDAEFREDVFKLGADDYLFNPYQTEELLFRVQKNIECYELKQKVRVRKNFFSSCCVCKKIRFDDNGHINDSWMEVEDFLKTEMDILLSSTYCPQCARTVQEDLMVQIDRLKALKVGRQT